MIGDVEKGAKVSAKGNIVVLGALRGAAYAGVCGNEDAVIVAFEMAPMSVRIAGLSLKKIGECFGGRDHSTIIHACEKIQKDRQKDPELNREIESLILELKK